MRNSVTIGCYTEDLGRFRDGYTVVAVDVIRSATTVTTAVAKGRRCFVAPSLDSAFQRAGSLENSILAGEVGGLMPPGFNLNNSPADLDRDDEVSRPLVLLSSSGTRLMYEASRCVAAYVACFRNYAAMADHLIGLHSTVAVLGAGTRGEFREEDQICCAWIADALLRAGYQSEDEQTTEMVARWRNASPVACLISKSAAYLRRSNQIEDLNFVLNHVNDLSAVFRIIGDEVLMTHSSPVPVQPQFEEAA